MIDYVELQRALTEMQPRQKLYLIIMAEIKKRGHWKGHPRGRAAKKKR